MDNFERLKSDKEQAEPPVTGGRRTNTKAIKKVLSWVVLIAVILLVAYLAFLFTNVVLRTTRREAARYTHPFICAGAVCAYVKFRADRIEKLLKEDGKS